MPGWFCWLPPTSYDFFPLVCRHIIVKFTQPFFVKCPKTVRVGLASIYSSSLPSSNYCIIWLVRELLNFFFMYCLAYLFTVKFKTWNRWVIPAGKIVISVLAICLRHFALLDRWIRPWLDGTFKLVSNHLLLRTSLM